MCLQACSRSSAAMSLRPCVKMATGTGGSRACKRERLFRARRGSGWPATRLALGQPARPQLCALTLKTSARQRTRADAVGPEMPERLAQLAPCRHVDDLDEVDDRKRANHAPARPALLITLHTLAGDRVHRHDHARSRAPTQRAEPCSGRGGYRRAALVPGGESPRGDPAREARR